jgi:hypothetical protein
VSTHIDHAPSSSEVLAASSREIPKSVKTGLLAAFAIGALLFIVGLFVDPDHAWRSFHANWLFFAGLSQAGVVFVAVQRITTARWSRSTIRLMEGYVAFLPVAFVFLLLTLFVGKGHVFWWTHEAAPVPEKATYFNFAFLAIRDIGIFGLMVGLSLWYIYTSVRLDVGHLPEWGAKWAANIRAGMRNGFRDERREIHSTHSLQGKLAVALVILFGTGWSVLAWDLSMGLAKYFQSTLYSWWFFMGAWLSALMLFAILIRVWNGFFNGSNGLIHDVNYHDIGKLCFAFTAFWGYLTFGQYLVIWYGNMAEETHFMRERLISPWKWVTVTSAFLIFCVPFFSLLSKSVKLNRTGMTIIAGASVLGMWMMRYIEVFPSTYGTVSSLPFGLWDIGVLLLYVGAWGWCYTAFMDAFPRMRVTLMTSPFRDEVQVPVNPETMEPLPAHE